MNYYKIIAQLVNNASFNDELKKAIVESIKSYNRCSLMAKNPKQIEEFSFSENDTALNLLLQSKNSLPMPSRALRLLSTILIRNSACARDCVCGKQLFKYKVVDCKMENSPKNININETSCDMAMVEKYIKLRQIKAMRLNDIDELINTAYIETYGEKR